MQSAGMQPLECQIIHHPNGVHEFIFLKPSRLATEQWYEGVLNLIEQYPHESFVRILIDMRTGIPPLRHLLSAVQRIQAQYDEPQPSRSVILYKENALLTLLQSSLLITRLNRRGQVNFFSINQREEAIKWLFEGKP